MKRFAFTMFELVIVIVIIGILAVAAMPSFNTNPLRDAAEQVAEHIRYTQHLAMVDDKYDPTDTRFHSLSSYNPINDGLWFKEWWRIRFYTNSGNVYYAVFNDRDRENNIDTATHTEPAIDPLSRKYLYVGNSSSDSRNNESMNLTSKYGISSVISSCDTGYIDFYFDNIGRPYVNSVTNGTEPPYSNILHSPCTVTLSKGSLNAVITIQPETGYVSVAYP